MEGDTKQYITLSALNRIYDKPLEERIIPFSTANLKKVETFSNFYSNLFQNIVSYSHNNFEIRILVDPFEKTGPSLFALEALEAEPSERLFLQFMALYLVSTSLGLEFIDFSQTGRIGRTSQTGQTTLQFPITFSEKEKPTSPWQYLPDIIQKNRHFRDLNKNNLQERFDQLKDKYLFDENQVYIYNYDDFASTILNTYPLSKPETDAAVKIKINTLNEAQKKIIKLNLYNHHRSGEVFFANLENPSDHLPDSLAQILLSPEKPGYYGEDFVSIIHQLDLFVKTFSFTAVVLMIDRLRTKEDAEFINYLFETPGLGSLVLLCFDPACQFIDFDLTLNEKPGNLLKKYLRFQGIGEPGPLQPGEIELLKIFHTLPVPMARDRLGASFSPGQSALIDDLIKKNLLKVNAGNVFLDCNLASLGIAITAAEEQNLLESFLTTPAADAFPAQIKYLLITRQVQHLKDLLKHLRHERVDIDTDLPAIKQLFTEKYFAPGKDIDIELLELLVSILVEENELPSAKEFIFNFTGAHRSVILKLKLAHIYKREKEYSEMDRLLTEIENEKSMDRNDRKDLDHRDRDFHEEYNYLRFVYHEKISGVKLANRYLKKIDGELYKQRVAVILSDRCLYKGDYKNAEIFLDRAVEYFHRHQYLADEIEARSHLAKLLREKQAFKEAEKSYQNLFIKSETKNYRLLSANIAVDLGNLYWAGDKFNSAETWYKKALKIFQTQENPHGIFLAKSNLVEVNKIKGHWRESKSQLESILEYDREKNTAAALAIDYLNIAHLEYLKHRYSGARDFISLARPLFEKTTKWNGIIECEILELKLALAEFSPQKPGKIDLNFFHRQRERLGKDQKVLVSIVEIAENDPLKQKTNLIIEKLNQLHPQTSRYEIAALLLNQYQSPGLLELLKSLSTELSQENKNYYYYEYFYLYYLHFCDIKEIQEKEKERFNEVYYFFQGNQRNLDPVILKYKHVLDEKDTQYDVFRSAELVGDYRHWKIPEDAFNSLVKALQKIAAVDLVRLVIYESIDNRGGPWIDFSYPLPGAGGHPFDSLTQEMIRRTLYSLEDQDLGLEDVKQRYQASEKAFYFFKNTKVIYWKISEVLYGVLLSAFSRREYGEYDFYGRHQDTLKKFASLIQRYYETDFKLNQKLDFIIGQSPVVKRLKEEILKVSKVDFPVLIRGESGSGKELVAKAIHLLGSRAGNPFIPVNAAAIPESLLEAELFGYKKGAFTGANENKTGLIDAAHNGTLFLDEIADLPLNLQAKLLRVLQENEIRRLGENKTHPVNIRLVCATNKDLSQLIAQNQFRDDLYFRIEVLILQVPPLRERLEDIPLLVQHFFKKHGFTVPHSGELQAIILHYESQPWTGNIRELESSVKRLITYYPDIDKELGENRQRRTLPPESGLIEAREKLEKTMILEALRENHWNKVETAVALKITRQHLFGLLKKYGIKLDGPLVE